MPKYNTLHYLVTLLKKFDIKNAVASPGFQNSNFNRFVQSDDNFSCYSVVDERSAGYVALGIARETNTPVVLSCTGATASRNYLSALTEAYYSKVPLIAITFLPYSHTKYNLVPQYVDRSISQTDIKALSVELPLIKSDDDIKKCLVLLNSALVVAKYKKMPVHINCPSVIDFSMSYNLPSDVWAVRYIYMYNDFKIIKDELVGKKLAVFIGEHSAFTDDEEKALGDFAESWNAPVFCDHTSRYHGKNKVLISQGANMKKLNSQADIIIDIGRICGDYEHLNLYKNAKIWRISEDGEFKSRLSLPVEYLFDGSEQIFFEKMINTEFKRVLYFDEIKDSISKISVPELPLSNPLICSTISKLLPKDCTLHLSILNSLRCMDFFSLDESIKVSSNVGGFGIDGSLSTIVGHSYASPQKMHFGIVGDLAFFYDMNAIGLRDIKNNVRIIVVNNNKGEEFRLNAAMEKAFGDTTDMLIAASGHYTNGVRGWAESCSFRYMSAKTKEEFLSQIDTFCNATSDKPIIFEVFTTDEHEQAGLNILRNAHKSESKEGTFNIYKTVKNLIR